MAQINGVYPLPLFLTLGSAFALRSFETILAYPALDANDKIVSPLLFLELTLTPILIARSIPSSASLMREVDPVLDFRDFNKSTPRSGKSRCSLKNRLLYALVQSASFVLSRIKSGISDSPKSFTNFPFQNL